MHPTPPPDYTLALNVLRADGLDTEAARAVLRVSPQSVPALAKRGLEEWADARTAEAAAEYAASPAGRQEAAQALIAAEQAQKARIEEAEAILRAKGIPAADLAALDDETKLRVTGVVDQAETAPKREPNGSRMIPRSAAPSAEELALERESDLAWAEQQKSRS